MSVAKASALDLMNLRVVVALLEEGSVTAAADRLGVTQSAVSHRLAALRMALDRPLFVKVGRQLVATPEGEQFGAESRDILTRIDRLLHARDGEAPNAEHFRIASTDYERSLLLHHVQKDVLGKAQDCAISFVWEHARTLVDLGRGALDLAVGRLPGLLSDDFRWTELFSDGFRVFYDPSMRSAPMTAGDYFASRHVRVLFSPSDDTYVDNALAAQDRSLRRRIATEVPSLWEVLEAVQGTDLLVTAPSAMLLTLSGPLQHAALPIEIPDVTVGMLWHRRTDESSSHRWLRQIVRDRAAVNLAEFALHPTVDGLKLRPPREA